MLGHIHRCCFVIPNLILFDTRLTTCLISSLLLALLFLFFDEFGRAVATKEAHLLITLHQHLGALFTKLGPIENFKAGHLVC